MTLLLVGRKVWHYKLATLPILALMLVGAVYIVAIKKPVYTTTASYILVPPPAPPTPDQIAEQPETGLGREQPVHALLGSVDRRPGSRGQGRQRSRPVRHWPRRALIPPTPWHRTSRSGSRRRSS